MTFRNMFPGVAVVTGAGGTGRPVDNASTDLQITLLTY